MISMKICSTRVSPRALAQRPALNLDDSTVLPQDSARLSVAGATLASVGSGIVSLGDATQLDKWKHMGVTCAATLALAAGGLSPGVSAASVFLVSTLGKELIHDLLLGRGTASLWDVSANLAGALAGYAALKSVSSNSSSRLLPRPPAPSL